MIVAHLRSPDRSLLRVWFPADGAHVPIVRKHLGLRPHEGAWALHWSAATRHGYFFHGGLVTVPEADLLGLRRVRLTGVGDRASSD